MREGTWLFRLLATPRLVVALEKGAGLTGLRSEGFHRHTFHGWVLLWLGRPAQRQGHGLTHQREPPQMAAGRLRERLCPCAGYGQLEMSL